MIDLAFVSKGIRLEILLLWRCCFIITVSYSHQIVIVVIKHTLSNKVGFNIGFVVFVNEEILKMLSRCDVSLPCSFLILPKIQTTGLVEKTSKFTSTYEKDKKSIYRGI
jgi:hypothetical protein